MRRPPTLEDVRKLQKQVEQLSQDIRQISHHLHPSILEDLGLTAALEELCEEFSAMDGPEVTFEHDAVPKDLPSEIATCLYRVGQEALQNVSKHARASQVRLTIRGKPEGLSFCIHDNGVGLNSDEGKPRAGMGIVSMKERVGLVGGQFSIHSQPGQGTEVKIFVPLPKSRESPEDHIGG